LEGSIPSPPRFDAATRHEFFSLSHPALGFGLTDVRMARYGFTVARQSSLGFDQAARDAGIAISMGRIEVA
jgi:hypothetical protein